MKTLSITLVMAALLLPMAACTTSESQTVSHNPLTDTDTVRDKTVTQNPITGRTTETETTTKVPAN